jgi:hypothetical protein
VKLASDYPRISDGRLGIGIKFCGGCNSYIDRTLVSNRIKAQCPGDKFFFTRDPDKSFVLIAINGCSTACVTKEDKNTMYDIVISGEAINYEKTMEADLPRAAIEIIRAIAEQK